MINKPALGMLADAVHVKQTEAEALQLGLDSKGRTLLVLKRRDQVLSFHLTLERSQSLVQSLISAQLSGLIK